MKSFIAHHLRRAADQLDPPKVITPVVIGQGKMIVPVVRPPFLGSTEDLMKRIDWALKTQPS